MWRDDPAAVRPMLAATTPAPLNSPDLAYERKYDGIRAIAAIEPAQGPLPSVRFWSRLGNEKTAQFPDVAARLQALGVRLDRPVVLDGEIVALDAHGRPVSFQHLQGRMHLVSPSRSRTKGVVNSKSATPSGASVPNPVAEVPTAFVAFDFLRDGDEDLRTRPLRERRRRLETLFAGVNDPGLRLSECAVGDGRTLHERAQREGWEGLIVKRLDSAYSSGRRSPDWRKLKFERRQTCVIGGWTEPRGSRGFLGSLILGVYDDDGRLKPVGHSGSGFSDAELERVWKRLVPLETKTCPFSTVPRTNERPHWVQPKLLAEVKFTEWTTDGQLRHPTYIGLRDDAEAAAIRREPDTIMSKPATSSNAASTRKRRSSSPKGRDRGHESAGAGLERKGVIKGLLDQVDALEHGSGSGVLQLPSGDRLDVSNLGKVFWPTLKLTKGDLFRHYLRVSPYILPVLEDRPLVMKRYPNGIDAKPFYQQRAPDVHPRDIRVQVLTVEDEPMPRIVGGSLTTLLYTVQLASISQDPWLSRVQSADAMDHAVIDLDPPDELPFRHVLDVARWVRDELEQLKAPGFPKLSGAGGLHIYVPMPPDTPYEAGMLFCQIISTLVSTKHPKAATIERSVKARGSRVYVDYLQNGRGKTLASVYSARSTDFAGVSTPVTWAEIDDGVTPQDFTIRNFADRLEAVGDLWAPLRKSKGADLRKVMNLK
jgi:bifunctional non-homologous end joining protein LigD